MAFERTGGQHGTMQTTPHPEAAELVKPHASQKAGAVLPAGNLAGPVAAQVLGLQIWA
jgi:hypothetical protein